MARRSRRPGGPTVGEEGELPPWWPNQYPPDDQIHLLNYDGFDWVAMYGSPNTARGRHTPVLQQNPTDMLAYQAGGPDETATGPVAFGYSCIWTQASVDRTYVPKPRAKKRWEDLSPGYRRDISGTMRHRLGLRTETQFKRYYETAPDLSRLRRHKVKFIVVSGTGRISFPKGKDTSDYPWLATWQK